MNLFGSKPNIRSFLLLSTMVVTRSGRGGSSRGLTSVSGFVSSSSRKTRQSKANVITRRSTTNTSKPSLDGKLSASKFPKPKHSKKPNGKPRKSTKTAETTKDRPKTTILDTKQHNVPENSKDGEPNLLRRYQKMSSLESYVSDHLDEIDPHMWETSG